MTAMLPLPIRPASADAETLADFVERLGDIPLQRILMQPAPGTAAETDIEGFSLCELIDGTIVRKATGFQESRYALLLGRLIDTFAEDHGLGIVTGADSLTRVSPGQLREPDVSFFRWERFPGHEVPEVAIIDTPPDLAVEVLSRKNTKAEIERKRRELFAAGTHLVWIMNPRQRTVEVWTDADTHSLLTEDDSLDGGEVLPGFHLPIREWIERARHGRKL